MLTAALLLSLAAPAMTARPQEPIRPRAELAAAMEAKPAPKLHIDEETVIVLDGKLATGEQLNEAEHEITKLWAEANGHIVVLVAVTKEKPACDEESEDEE